MIEYTPPKRFEIVTTDGIFLAIRYDKTSADAAKADFEPRWPQGIIVKEVPLRLVRV